VQFYTDPSAGMRSLQDFKKISILEVRGYCYGWHFYQAADADLVISSEDALYSATPPSATPASPPGSGSGAR
jgi:enoyl-CoA hydratase